MDNNATSPPFFPFLISSPDGAQVGFKFARQTAFDTLTNMTGAVRWIAVVAVWAAIYLPALGSFEIRGEEGRRILPAVNMIQSADYLVPRVGGDPYFRKPPLINWLIAGSFKLFRVRNEWTARVPSVLCVLSVAIAFLTVASRSLGPFSATVAALLWLTTFGTIEKGRLAEIEALYVSVTGLAMITWLSWWHQKRSPWLTWTVPWIFLGLGWLAKGPTHLIFFYALVLAVLWQTNRWKALFHPAHLAGICVMLAVFAAWAVPFIHATTGSRVVNRWSEQFVDRISGSIFYFWVWVLAIPRAIGLFLPWVLFVPFVRLRLFGEADNERIARALAWSVAVPFTVINLIPSSAPRYSLPVLVPFCWLMASAFANHAFALPPRLALDRSQVWKRIGRWTVATVAICTLIGFPVAALVAQHHQKVKNIAAEMNAAVPASEHLYAVNPGYQPFFFYMHVPVTYLDGVDDVPVDAKYVVARAHNEEDVLSSQRWAPRRAREVLRATDYRNQTMVLFVVEKAS